MTVAATERKRYRGVTDWWRVVCADGTTVGTRHTIADKANHKRDFWDLRHPACHDAGNHRVEHSTDGGRTWEAI